MRSDAGLLFISPGTAPVLDPLALILRLGGHSELALRWHAIVLMLLMPVVACEPQRNVSRSLEISQRLDILQ